MSALIHSSILGNPRLAAVCLDALLKSFVVLAFAGALCLCWRRAAATTRHLIWCVALVSLLFLPLLPYVLPAAQRPLWSVSSGSAAGNEISLSLELTPTTQNAAINNPEPVPANNSTQPSAKENVRRLFNARVNHNWLGIGFAVWMCGLILTLLYPVIGQLQFRKISTKARSLETLEWTPLLLEASETLGLRRAVTLLQSEDNVMPLTWGWLWPKVLMPAEAEQWSTDRRRVVLLHELAHVKRWDCLTQNIARLVCGLYWFNPLAWIAARQMCIERERACDDLVLNGGCKASEYTGHLVQIAQTFRRAPQAAGIAMARSSNLEQRVTAIVDASRTRRLRPAGLAGVLISIIAVMFYIGGYKTSIARDGDSGSLREQQVAQIENFSAQKLKQSQFLATAAGEEITDEFQNFFKAAKAGDFQMVTNTYADFKAHHPQYSKQPGKDSRPAYRTSYWQPMLEIFLAYDHVAHCDPKYTQIAVEDITRSIPPGSIYFGGTDPGRGLPTAFGKSQIDADPFYVLTQNALADDTYLNYLRCTYGDERKLSGKLVDTRRSDSELSALDAQFRDAEQKALSLELSKPEDDPERKAAERLLEDLNPKISERVASILKNLQAGANSSQEGIKPKSIYIPTHEEQEGCFNDYKTNAAARLKHDREFPKEPRQVQPGESVKVDADGHTEVSGQIAVMAVNARIAKIIFDRNPDRDFYVEESYPLNWMYPQLEPSGPIMKINRVPLAELPDDVIQKDHEYWQGRLNGMIGNWLTDETPVRTVADFAEKIYVRKDLSGFTGDPAFVRDDYAPKMFSKWRSAIGGVYSWRTGVSPDNTPVPSQYLPKSDADRQRMIKEADFAFKQAFAICPASPEAVYRYVNFLLSQNRKSDAFLIAQAAAYIDPEHYNVLMRNLSQVQETEASASLSNRMQELRSLLAKKQGELDQRKTILEHLKDMDRATLDKALPQLESDNELNMLKSELDLAQQSLSQLKLDYAPDHPKYQNAQATLEDLQRKIHDRTDGLMIGLQSKLDATAASVATLKAKLEDLQRTNPHNP